MDKHCFPFGNPATHFDTKLGPVALRPAVTDGLPFREKLFTRILVSLFAKILKIFLFYKICTTFNASYLFGFDTCHPKFFVATNFLLIAYKTVYLFARQLNLLVDLRRQVKAGHKRVWWKGSK